MYQLSVWSFTLVREHEYLVIKNLLNGETTLSHIEANIQEEIPGFKHEQLEHALRFLEEGFAVKIEADEVHLCGEREEEYEAYLQDLLNYGLTQYEARYADTKEDFLLWQDYRQDQVLLKILENRSTISMALIIKWQYVYLCGFKEGCLAG